ncbi:hypothetical protein M501DRAFT_941567 [Patellaria atrata CBS 101060]|uniref:Acyltransferase 3 domain-containing protein n=1 Tax=Patellaria atrata CBS 101060 TaxID=1346257 RepID=A0A9P4S5U6_9PEZI|nr:hypothetical protein M501DRAFT_941567 [Patellaria atrata CBS 101060]
MAPPRDANWVDGLRGIASFMVVCGHLCTCFAPYLHAPAMGPEGPAVLFQLPFFRLCVGGRSAVGLFFLITGYVNSIGPISKSRAGNTEAAFTGLAKSSLSRSGKLILPTATATLFSWFLANTNAYHMTMHVDSTWIRQGFHRQEPTVWKALKSLTKAEISAWTTGWNEYDGTQWTLILFLEGAFMVYLTMLATVLCKPRARKLVYFLLYAYSWMTGEIKAQIKCLNIIVGMVLAEAQSEYGSRATSILPTPVPSLLIILGMFMAGYPQDVPHHAPWSNAMTRFLHPLVPSGTDVRRYWDHLGAATVMIGVFHSKNARKVLTSPLFNFLGRVSFPVYLLHNQLIKSVLTWMIYLPSAMNPPVNEKGEQQDLQRGSLTHVLVAIAIFYWILYRLAYFWVQNIDPVLARAVDRMTEWAYGEGSPIYKPVLATHNGHAAGGKVEQEKRPE